MDRHAWKHVGWILLIALAVRLAGVALWHYRTEGRFFFGDSETYWQLGRAIAHGDEYVYPAEGFDARVFRTPGYPLLLAPLFLASDEPPVLWARIQVAVVGSLAAGAVWCLARQLFCSRAALVAGLIAAVYPGAVATSSMVLTETPFSALMLLQFCMWVAAWHSTGRSRAVKLGLGSGAAAGAAVLVRPSWLLFTPAVIGIMWAGTWLRNRPAFRGWALAVLAAMLAVLVPWWVRNGRVTGHFVPTTLQVGASLYDGLNPHATGASDMAFVERFVAEQQRRDVDAEVPLEVRLDRRMRREALAWARRHPACAARLALVKFARMWNLWPNEPELSGWGIRLAMAGTYVPVMVLAMFGAWRTFHLGWPYVLCWLPAVYFTALHIVFVSSIRYREPAMLPLMVLAAGAVFSRATTPQPQQEVR